MPELVNHASNCNKMDCKEHAVEARHELPSCPFLPSVSGNNTEMNDEWDSDRKAVERMSESRSSSTTLLGQNSTMLM